MSLGAFGALPVIYGFQTMMPTMLPVLPGLQKIMLMGALTAIVVGAFAALIPAYFAARLDPVKALRYE